MTIASLIKRLRAGDADHADVAALRRLVAIEENHEGGPGIVGADARLAIREAGWAEEIVLVVATDRAGGIGIDGRLPWHFPEDLARFRRQTLGHPIVMGRKTFQSIGRALPGRRNIVVSRAGMAPVAGVEVFENVESALQAADGPLVSVIGGGQIYAATAGAAHRIERTLVDGVYGCDAHFHLDQERYELVASTRGGALTYETWVARRPAVISPSGRRIP